VAKGESIVQLQGTPSDQLQGVLATGETAARYVFISLSAREPDGRDAEYIEWHSLDHRPEQYRLAKLRGSLRLVSTPACRTARAASVGQYDQVDHVMTYLFTDEGGLPGFGALGGALHLAGRMPLRLPSIGYMTGGLAGKMAAPRAVAGADVIPWRPALGVYLIIEKGFSSAADLVDVPGVAGAWWYRGGKAPRPYDADATGLQITFCYLDDDPIDTSARLAQGMKARWASGAVQGLLAAPFFTIVPFDWTRHLPGTPAMPS
jgi:hypothetical protein